MSTVNSRAMMERRESVPRPSSPRVLVLEVDEPATRAFEESLDRLGAPIALPHRQAWAAHASRGSLAFAVSTTEAEPRGVCVVEVHRVRALPGHVVYRLPRFGHGLAEAEMEALLRAVEARARVRRNVLRIVVEAFAADATELACLERVLEARGFAPRVPPTRYARTLRLDLAARPDEVFAALPRTARRNLRAAQRSGLVVRAIDDPSMAPAIASLETEAFARTGGAASATDWPALIGFARAHPRLVRIAGIFTAHDGREELLGFATGHAHGDHVEYAMAGTTRREGLRISIGYPLLWNLIEWACAVGASWFDFGGITSGTVSDDGDALGGISDFKRHFGGVELHVGGQWGLEVRPVRSALADAVGRARRAVARVTGR